MEAVRAWSLEVTSGDSKLKLSRISQLYVSDYVLREELGLAIGLRCSLAPWMLHGELLASWISDCAPGLVAVIYS